MKLLFFFSALLIIFLPATAQHKTPPVVENFAKKINNSTALVFDDHLNVLALQTDDDKYDVVGIDEKMQTTWKIPLDGNNLWMKKFKNRILVLTSLANKSKAIGDVNYTAYMLDPATGKIITNKVVYHATNEFVQQPQIFTGEGDFFKLAVRITTRKENTNMWSDIFKSGSTYAKEWNETADLRIISYTEKLDTINTLKPVLTNGVFLSLTVSKSQDVFISWFNGPSMEIYKYDAGQTKPSNFLSVPVDFKGGKNSIVTNSLFLRPSENRDILNFGLIYNNEKGWPELGIGKLNFSTNQKNFVRQTFDKASLNTLKKNFQPVNKDLDDVDFGLPEGMLIQYIEEVNGKIIVATASNWSQRTQYSTNYFTRSMVVSGYDENLNFKYAQILPVKTVNSSPLTSSFNVRKNELNILANNKKAVGAFSCVYAVLDLNAGKWIKMYKLSREKISLTGISRSSSALWFGDRFILPYFGTGSYSAKSDVTLQTNFYQD